MPYCIECGSSASYKIPEGDNRERIICDDDSCGYIHYTNPHIICGAVVVHEDKVLLCRRAIEPQYGKWTLPAGFMEIGESMLGGAERETLEEAEATVTDMKLYCLQDLPYIGHVNVFYLANLKDGKFGAGIESLECALLSEDEIDWDNIAFKTIEQTLKHYFEDRKKYTDFKDFPLHEAVLVNKNG